MRCFRSDAYIYIGGGGGSITEVISITAALEYTSFTEAIYIYRLCYVCDHYTEIQNANPLLLEHSGVMYNGS